MTLTGKKNWNLAILDTTSNTLADLRPTTSRASSSWMYTHLWAKCCMLLLPISLDSTASLVLRRESKLNGRFCCTTRYMMHRSHQISIFGARLYPQSVPFIEMRMFAAACGVGLIPISYLTIKRSGHSTQAAIICAVLITFENALITQSRFILLDAPMMLFMGYTLLAWINFYNHRNRPFTRGWWLWLLQTGTCLFLSSRYSLVSP